MADLSWSDKFLMLTAFAASYGESGKYGSYGKSGPGPEMAVLARLLWHCNYETRQCNPSYDTLALALGMSRRTAMRAVKQLVEGGWISRPRAEPNEWGAPAGSYGFNWDRKDSPPARHRPCGRRLAVKIS
jgi:Helix-turn-helix domain